MRVEDDEHAIQPTDEPPGPVAVDEPDRGHYDVESGQAPGPVEAEVADVDAGEFPPDDYLARQPETGQPDTEGHTYGHPLTGGDGTPVDEVGAGEPVATDEPAVGVAPVPSEPVPDETDRATVRTDRAPDEAEPAAPVSAMEPEEESADEFPAQPAAVTEPADETEVQPEDVQPEDVQPEAVQPEAVGAEEAPEPEELSPGEVPVTAGAAFWETGVVEGYRDRWQQIQLRFIDNPRTAAEQAQGLVNDVVQGLSQALGRQRSELDRWQDAELDDTEELRMTIRRYRDLLDRLFAF
jgi:hypothetical protein